MTDAPTLMPDAAVRPARGLAPGPALAVAVGALGYYLLALGCIHLSRQPQHISTMWLPDAFASLWLLMLAPAQRRWLLPALALTIPLANLSYGDPWRVALSFVPANLLQIVLSLRLLERHVDPARAVVDPLALLRALVLAGVLPALAGAATAVLTVPVLLGTPLGPSPAALALSWVVSTAFGVATLLPLGLWLVAHGPTFRRLARPGVLLGLAGVVAASALAPTWLPYPFAYVMLVLMAVALFGGFLAAAVAALCASVLLNAVFALGLFSGAGAGTGAVAGGADALLTVLPIVLAVIPTVLIGAVREGLDLQLHRTRAGEALQRSMLDASPVLLCLLGSDGRILRMNAAGARLLGAADADALLGQSLADRLQGSGDQVTLATLDGRHLRTEQHRASAPQPGDPGAVVVALRDIGPELEMQRLREETARIEADSRAKSEFLSRMSHELRTPLNAVLGFTQVMGLTLGRSPPERQRQQLQQIEQAGWHLLEMIDDVLDLSRLEAGQVGLRMDAVPLGPAIAQARSMVQADADRRRVQIHAPALPPSAWVQADALRLRQVLINLLSNAVKYNREGGEVHVELLADGDGWTLRVRDTGLGISEAQQAHVFEPFNRLDQARSAVAGTGIGLSITRRLVHAMGGRIGFSSRPGEGSSFEVTLGAAQPPEAPHASAAAPPSPGAAVAPAKLLYVEDDPASLALVEQALALDGHQVLHASDARSALALARSAAPALLLVDIQLPDASGLDLRAWLRDDPALAGLPCIALSAQAAPADLAAAQAAGFGAYLTKPVDVPALRRAVAAALAGAGRGALSR